MQNSKRTQCQRIVDYMEKHGCITQLEALTECGVMRLASRISDLKRSGVEIESEMVTVCNRFGEKCRVKQYRLKVGALDATN